MSGSSNGTVQLLSKENKAIPFNWVVFLNLLCIKQCVAETKHCYEFFKVSYVVDQLESP